MFNSSDDIAREYQEILTQFSIAENLESISPNTLINRPDELDQLLKRLERSSWVCAVAEA